MLTIQLPSPKTNPKDIITPSDDRSDEQPCEKYLQFMDSSHQERTFMIEKLIGKHLSPTLPITTHIKALQPLDYQSTKRSRAMFV